MRPKAIHLTLGGWEGTRFLLVEQGIKGTPAADGSVSGRKDVIQITTITEPGRTKRS